MGEISATTQNEFNESTTSSSRQRCVSDSNVELQKNDNKKMNGTGKHGDRRRRNFGHTFGKRLRLILRPWKWRRKNKRSRYLGSASQKELSTSDDVKHVENKTDVSKMSYSTSDLSGLTSIDVKFTMDLDNPPHNNGDMNNTEHQNSSTKSDIVDTKDIKTDNNVKINGDIPKEHVVMRTSPSVSTETKGEKVENFCKPNTEETNKIDSMVSAKIKDDPTEERQPPPAYPITSLTIITDPPPNDEKNVNIPTASHDADDEDEEDVEDDQRYSDSSSDEDGGNHHQQSDSDVNDDDSDDSSPPPIPPRGASVSYSYGSDSSTSSRVNSDDEEETNNHVITGLASKVKRSDSLALKLGIRPTRAELEGKNIIHTQTDDEKQAMRSNIGSNLVRRLSQRPTKEELEQRNIYRSTTDEETHQKNLEETKRQLSRKLSRRPTIKELRKKKIIGFNEYVEVFEVQEYDRRADKPWTRLTPKDKASIRKELNEYKEFEMDVHEDSKRFTRFHRP